MDLIIGANTVPASGRDVTPTTGTPQWATDGNPSASPSIPATDFPAYHYNMVIAELYNLILAAGLTPDGTNWQQVRIAAQKLGLIGAYSSTLASEIGGYPKFAVINYGGINYQSLVDENLSVPGQDATKWQVFCSGTFVVNGESWYNIDLSGRITQGGRANTNSGGNLVLTFPYTFPAGVLYQNAQESNAATNWALGTFAVLVGNSHVSPSQMQVFTTVIQVSASGNNPTVTYFGGKTVTFDWIAVGK